MNGLRQHTFRGARQVIAALASLAAFSALQAQSFVFEPVAPVIVSARMDGFGGAFSALEAGFDTLSTNPAALAYVDKEWSFARLACEVSGPLFDIPAVLQADDMTTGILDLVADNNGVYMGANATGPLSVGKVDRNLGFGVFNRTLTRVNVPSISKASLLSGEEILLVGGYGLVLLEKGPHSVSGGLQLKGFFQTFLYENDTAVQVLDTFTNLNLDNIPSVLSTGFGVDVGTLYRYGDDFSAAITCKNLYTPVFSTRYASSSDFLDGNPDSDTVYDRITPDLTLGVAYAIPIPERWTTFTRWNVMFDYRDALAVFRPLHRNLILNVAIGTEVQLLDVVYLRAGIRDAYISAGLGLDLTVCEIDFAMYGTELGLEPGSRPLLNIALSTAFEY